MIELESFRIRNCFGFLDSGTVKLSDPHNLIYILGRNSSGKTSLLRGIRAISHDQELSSQRNFANFKMQGEPSLCGIFRKEPGDFLANTQMKKAKELFASAGLNLGSAANYPEVTAFLTGIQEKFEHFIVQIDKAEYVQVWKLANDTYQFWPEGSKEQYTDHIKGLNSEIIKLFGSNNGGEAKNYGGVFQNKVDTQQLHSLLAEQLPTIKLFNEEYPLTGDLPDRYTQHLPNDKSLASKFLDYLGRKEVKKLLLANDPEDQDSLKGILQAQADRLTEAINQHQGTFTPNRDLLKMIVSHNNGLQITVRTDGKKSFFSQISDNTKFLIAYFLYLLLDNVEADVLLFDEPSNGFHASAQKSLLNFLKSLAKAKKLVIVSTHSEHMIDLDLLSSVRCMDRDEKSNIIVTDYYVKRSQRKGESLALQPVLNAIGLRYGTTFTIGDKAIVCEGITELLYLRAFNKLLNLNVNLPLAPTKGDSHIPTVVSFLIAQGVSLKIIIDKGQITNQLINEYGIDMKYIWEVPVPTAFAAKSHGSGIEDLFSKKDFERIAIPHSVDQSFHHISNSHYAKDYANKRLTAHELLAKIDTLSQADFEPETIKNFTDVLNFCANAEWFRL